MVPRPFSRSNSAVEELNPAVVIVTPYSTGCCVAKEIQDRGYTLIRLWNAGFSEAMKLHVPKSSNGLSWALTLEEQETLGATATLILSEAALHGWELVSVVCGGEAGVDLADELSEYMGFLTNGTNVPNRRDKKVQQELIKAAGLRSTRQAAGSKLEDVEEFLRSEKYPIIVKPEDSAGSDGVKLCQSYEEASEHFLTLTTTHQRVNGGGACEEVLCQEYLKGKEYVVDHVSRDGVHKTVMVWVYDKRPANGATFVYFGDIPIDSESPEAKLIIPYVRTVLDALGVKHGPSHGEVIITEDGPCLVEMNCRAHGGDGIWQPLCRALCGGYTQVTATADAYFDKQRFDMLPDKPASPFKTFGQCVDLVSYQSGVVKSAPGYDVIKLLPSFVCLETGIKAGKKVTPTVDLASDAGTLVVMNTNKEILERDIALIRQMESSCVLFQLYSDDIPNNASNETKDKKESKDESTFRKLSASRRACSFDTRFLPSIPQARTHRRLISNDTPAMFMAAQHI